MTKKNQRPLTSHIHWPYKVWKKNNRVLGLTKKEYNKYFDYIIIICPTLRCNKTYCNKNWITHKDNLQLIEPKDRLYQWKEKLLLLLAHSETLFIIDDIIADESLDKQWQSLLELAISSTIIHHCNHHLWLLKQSYSAIPKNLRRQFKAIFVWYPREKADLKMIHDEL